MNNSAIYAIQILFVAGISIGCQGISFDDGKQWLNVARYAIYILTISAIPEACKLVHAQCRQPDPAALLRTVESARGFAVIFAASTGLLLYFGQRLLHQDFVYVAAAWLLVKYPEMQAAKTSINYGVGMACSYFEGYLIHVLPSDGASFVGFEENIRAYEDGEGVLFPVKKMFIIITKSLYSPPNLNEFNRGTDVPHLEQMRAFADVTRSVAGVRDRRYHNTAYKIYRPGAAPVCLAAECATPLHTLHRVLNNRTLYDEMAEVDVAAVVDDFCTTLRNIVDKSPQCRGKCELIFYNHEDPSQNLAEILLTRIRELAPDFEQKIIARRGENVLNEEH